MSLYYKINMLRQLYELRSHRGVQIDRWIYSSPDQQPVEAQSMLIPQLSLHTTGGTVLDTHVYGRQAAAQVYGNVTATQEILDSAAGSAQQFPWVRYYARRFGDTTVPLKLDSPTITGSSVLLTPSDFDELEEIVDGWKEITLRFDTPPTMGAGTSPQWRWSATGETAGNRWEVLGAYAPALSGTPGNFTTAVPAPNQLSLATYGAPVSGANENLGWVPGYAPMVSATTDDQTADAVLMFARDLPTITGFSSSIQDQEVVGIGLDCGLDPCCIPSEIQYVSLSWTPAQTLVLADTFTRASVSDGWGVAESGQPWIVDPPATDYSVAGGYGIHTFSGVNDIFSYVSNSFTDVDIMGRFQLDQTPTGGDVIPGLMLRQTIVGSTYYRGDIRISTAGVLLLRIQEAVAGVFTVLAQQTLGQTFSVNQFYWLRFQAIGTTLRLRFWLDGEQQPDIWNLTVDDTSIAAGAVGVVTSALTGNTNSGAHVFWDDLLAGAPYALDTKVELQRKDAVETDWNTIMMATNPAISGFRDYEARVGIQSTYRARLVDLYDFPGPWSSEVTATIEAPGVTIGCDDGHLLIFTSNEEQDGSLNLAYSSVWEQGRTVEESFLFPESQFVQLQALYNRDFFLAFRPQERGGEQFSRTVLVQAAAIAPETLADFTSFRDMAWADVPYICVRDEDGNRWFATVLVPSGRVLRDRRLYLAPVEVIEVTSTPSEVDP